MITQLLRLWGGDQSLHGEINKNAASGNPINKMSREQLARDEALDALEHDKDIMDAKKTLKLNKLKFQNMYDSIKEFQSMSDTIQKISTVSDTPSDFKSTLVDIQHQLLIKTAKDIWGYEPSSGGFSGGSSGGMGGYPGYASSPMDQDNTGEAENNETEKDDKEEEESISIKQWMEKNSIPYDNILASRIGTETSKLCDSDPNVVSGIHKRREDGHLNLHFPIQFEYIIHQAYKNILKKDQEKVDKEVAKEAAKTAKPPSQGTIPGTWMGSSSSGGPSERPMGGRGV